MAQFTWQFLASEYEPIIPYQMFSHENIHTSNQIQTEKVAFKHLGIYAFIYVYIIYIHIYFIYVYNSSY